jgi:hypothetical protein
VTDVDGHRAVSAAILRAIDPEKQGGSVRKLTLTCNFPGGAEGIRTPDPLDANEVRYRTALQPREHR